MLALSTHLIACLLMSINGYLHLHNTIIPNDLDDVNCLYEQAVFNVDETDSELMVYCIRQTRSPASASEQRCLGERSFSFAELNDRHISAADLFDWFAPIDTISAYEHYRLGHSRSEFDTMFCNCTNNWFGPHCEYKVPDAEDLSAFGPFTLNDIVTDQLGDRMPSNIDSINVNDLSSLTCYEGVRCHSAICLDWRQICDGVLNCEHGEDEPEECILLELNQCQSDEYRCRSGSGIPKRFLSDIVADCADGSDEEQTYHIGELKNRCLNVPSWDCDTRSCPFGTFSCGDGTCVTLTTAKKSCLDARDSYFRQKLYHSSSPHSNISSACRSVMICASGAATVNSQSCSNTREPLLQRFQTSCPTRFEFNDHRNLLYPFVRFIYDQEMSSSSTWREPTYFCFNRSNCESFPLENLLSINGLTCLQRDRVDAWSNHSNELTLLFSACRSSYRSKELFFCAQSRKFINVERVNDRIADCFDGEDESEERYSTLVDTLLSSNRFKCLHSNQWILSVFAGTQQCDDGSDAWFIDQCKTARQITCLIRRGVYSTSIYYTFQENCNGQQLLARPVANETDESHCDQWPSSRLCDDFWDLDNGADELHCSLTTGDYIRRTIFQCATNQHYCWYDNGTWGCLDIVRAGDGHRDCLGNTDERRALTSCLYRNPIDPFQCASGVCVPLIYLCDGFSDCVDHDDELICPWMFNITGNLKERRMFSRNGSVITRKLRCNQQIDFPPVGEDEWFCDLTYMKTNSLLLDWLEPQYQSSKASTPLVPSSKKRISLDRWYCHFGIALIQHSSKQLECFCSPNYYGPRCEFQSERILLIVHVDIVASLIRHRNKQRTIRLLACLLYNETIVHYEQVLNGPLTTHRIFLQYPRPPPKAHGRWSVRFDAFLVGSTSVEYKASWFYDVPFLFLPVSRLAVHLLLNDGPSCRTLNCHHGQCRQYLNFPYRPYCHCHDHWFGSRCDIRNDCPCVASGRCVARRAMPICICPLGRFGHRCEGWFDSCRRHNCRNGATCVSLDDRQSFRRICLCPMGYRGTFCEHVEDQLDLFVSRSFASRYSSTSTATFMHVLRLERDSPGVFTTEHRRLVDLPLTVFFNGRSTRPLLIVLQVCLERDQTHFYVAHLTREPRNNATTAVGLHQRCFHADELLHNSTFARFSSVRKPKYYHHLCLTRPDVQCFVDEHYLCFCDLYRQLDCGVFLRESTRCSQNYCHNAGRCIQNNFDGIWDFRCVCQLCTFGSLCQLTTSEYALSLDLMLGQDILPTMPIKSQTGLIQAVLVILLVMFISGTVSNILSFFTLTRPKVQEHGCGFYLACLPMVGQLGLATLTGRYFYLLLTQVHHVEHRLTAYWSCIVLEYVLNVCTAFFDWLTTSVAMERCVNIFQGVKYQKALSASWAKRVLVFLFVAVLVSSSHEFFSHQLIEDPRATTVHTWCVIMFRWSWLKYYRLTVNLINLIVPCLLQLGATLFLLHRSTRLKQTLSTKKEEKRYWRVWKRQLPLYGSPFVLIVVSMSRLIFSFTLACIVHPWQKYLYLMAYCVSFFPLMATFPIFVLPAKVYRDEFSQALKQLHRFCIVKLFE